MDILQGQGGGSCVGDGDKALGTDAAGIYGEGVLPQGGGNGFEFLGIQQILISVWVGQEHFGSQALAQLYRAAFLQPAGEVEQALALCPVAGGILHHNGDVYIGVVFGNFGAVLIVNPHLGIVLNLRHQRACLGQGIGDAGGIFREKFSCRRRGIHHDQVHDSLLGAVLQGQGAAAHPAQVQCGGIGDEGGPVGIPQRGKKILNGQGICPQLQGYVVENLLGVAPKGVEHPAHQRQQKQKNQEQYWNQKRRFFAGSWHNEFSLSKKVVNA